MTVPSKDQLNLLQHSDTTTKRKPKVATESGGVEIIDLRSHPYFFLASDATQFSEWKLDPDYHAKILYCPKWLVPWFVYLGYDVDHDSLDKDARLRNEDNTIDFFPFLPPIDFLFYCQELRASNQLREFLEGYVAFHPFISDLLYRADFAEGYSPSVIPPLPVRKPVRIATWQAYGRKYVRDFVAEVLRHDYTGRKDRCLILPCALTRPYDKSPTYRRLRGQIPEWDAYHKVVVTSIGVVPEEFWEHPLAMAYDSGVPDLWRVFEIVKQYFGKVKYSDYSCYLNYEPYVEMLRLAGVIEHSNAEIKKYLY